MSSPPGDKSPTALRTIGEVVAETGVAAHVLRYWERQVPALRPVRRAGDRRYYRPEDVRLVSEIARLINDEGYTLDGAARAARQPGAKRAVAASSSGTGAGDTTPELPFSGLAGARGSDGAISLARLRGLRNRLQVALDAAA